MTCLQILFRVHWLWSRWTGWIIIPVLENVLHRVHKKSILLMWTDNKWATDITQNDGNMQMRMTRFVTFFYIPVIHTTYILECTYYAVLEDVYWNKVIQCHCHFTKYAIDELCNTIPGMTKKRYFVLLVEKIKFFFALVAFRDRSHNFSGGGGGTEIF